MQTKDSKDLIEMSLNLGAHKAYMIDVEEIPFDKSLRSYCEANYCGSYGKNYSCPPFVGDVETLIDKAKKFPKALVFQTVHKLEDSYDFEGMDEAARKHEKTADLINDEVKKYFNNYLRLTAGGCKVCSECSLIIGEPCRFPDKAVSSLEAYCINVSTLASLCDMSYINGQNTVTYFGAFFIG